MKDYHCRDIGFNCEFVARSEDPNEVLKLTEKHNREFHKVQMTPALEEKMRWLIHDKSSQSHRDSVQRNS